MTIHSNSLRTTRHVGVAVLAAAMLGAAGVGGLSAAEGLKKPCFAYRSFWPEFGAMGQFRDAGVDTVCIFAANTDNSLGQPYSKYPPVWRWFGKYDFDSLNKQYDDVLAVNPDADFICMIDLNTPIWLQRQLALRGQSAECESFTMLSCACANPAWRKATNEYLEAVVKHMEARYGDRIRAYLLACGQTDEWMDYSRGVAGRTKTLAWKAWRQAQGKAEVPVPAFERLDRASFDNLIRDPATEQDVVDYAQFTGDLIADTVLEFAAKTRALIPKQRQIGMFFGYLLELTHSRMVWAGHLEYERLYRSPDIDFFISPGLFVVTPEKLEVLKKHVFNNNRTVFFAYAPAICDGRNLDPKRVQALTGTAFKTPGVGTVQRDGWKAVYVPGYDDLTPQVLRQAAVDAGVTILCQDPVPVYANERLVAIHMAQGGEKEITLPADCRQVRELFTGQVIPVAQRRFSYRFKTPDTALFEMAP